MEKKKTTKKVIKIDPPASVGTVNEPLERQSATLGDVAHVNGEDLKEKVVHFEERNQLEEAINWAFEKPAEALFVSLSSVLSQAHPEVKKRVTALIKLPPEERLKKVLGPQTFNYIKSRLPQTQTMTKN